MILWWVPVVAMYLCANLFIMDWVKRGILKADARFNRAKYERVALAVVLLFGLPLTLVIMVKVLVNGKWRKK